MALNKDVKIPPVIWYILPILVVVFFVILFFVSSVRIDRNVPAEFSSSSTYSSSFESELSSSYAYSSAEKTPPSGLQVVSLVGLYVSLFAIVPLMAIWLWKYSKGVELVTKEKMSFAMSLLILLAVPDGIDILIVQDAFNKIAADAPSATHLGPAAPIAPAA